jgi:outer membrane protein OmpA-like peptidoglycan-associated protein
MRSINTPFQLIALAFVLVLSGAAFGQDSNTSSQSQDAGNTTKTSIVGVGEKLKVEGIVIKRDADTFTLRGSDGTETVVVLTGKTSVKTVHRGLFRAGKDTGVSDILRGLRLKAEGRGNTDGQLVAENIRFDEQDLRTAQALESRVDPVETQANSTEALAQSNQTRITEAEQNAQRLSAQVEELSGVANAAGALAANAESAAEKAQSDANTANERITGLDDYEVYKTVSVHFKTGSARLSPEAKAEIDEAATSIQGEDLKGWLVAVMGYTDSTGNTATNDSLSDRRANAVIRYLVTKYDLPLRRIVQPYGYGSLEPVADNETREGRAMNRRVEIRVLVNKGISSQADSQQVSYENQ